MKVILDANVIIAAFASRGLCESVLELCLEQHELILSNHLLTEIKDKLTKKIKLPKSVTNQIVSFLKENSVIALPEPVPKDACRDQDDLKVLGLASKMETNFIVTGDKDLLVLKSYKKAKKIYKIKKS